MFKISLSLNCLFFPISIKEIKLNKNYKKNQSNQGLDVVGIAMTS